MSEQPDYYNPPEHERVFYRHAVTGDLGWMVRREGKDCVLLNRPNQEIVKPFAQGEWIQEVEHRPMTRRQLAQVAFEADKQLCFFLGLHDLARRDWRSMVDEKRNAWIERGPTKGSRQALFQAIMAALEPLGR